MALALVVGTFGRAGPGEGIAGAPALPSAQVSSGGPSGNAIRSVLGRDFGSGGSPFCCRKATLRRFPWVATGKAAIPSLCGTTLCGRPWGGRIGGSGHVDRHVCRDDCVSERHGACAEPGAAAGGQGPTAARRGLSRRRATRGPISSMLREQGR